MQTSIFLTLVAHVDGLEHDAAHQQQLVARLALQLEDLRVHHAGQKGLRVGIVENIEK